MSLRSWFRPLSWARRKPLPRAMIYYAVAAIVVLALWNVYHPSPLVIRGLQARWPDVLWKVDFSGPRPPLQPAAAAGTEPGEWPPKLIALTIDDAPSSETDKILDVLTRHDATATFFVIGRQVQGREKQLADIIVQGSELGNHAMADEASRSLTIHELERQIREVERMITKAYADVSEYLSASTANDTATTPVGPPPAFFRPGSGFFSTAMRDMVKRIRYQLVLGSIYPHDPQIKYWTINAAHILSSAQPGAIIVCHDRRSWTAPMLESVLPELRAKGYQVVSVSRLLQVASAYGVNPIGGPVTLTPAEQEDVISGSEVVLERNGVDLV